MDARRAQHQTGVPLHPGAADRLSCPGWCGWASGWPWPDWPWSRRSGRGAGLDLLGGAAGLAAAICSAGYFLLGEHGASRHDSFGLTAAGLAIGAVVLAVVSPPWTLPSGLLAAPAVLGGLRPPVWLVLLVLAVVGTVLPYLAGLRALRDLPSALASVLALVEPLAAAVLAWLLLGQALGLTQLAGAALLLAGAVLVQLAGPKPSTS